LIITRYLIRESAKPLVVILGILIVLFGSYSTAGFLSDAVNGLLPTDTIVELIGLKVLISLEVLIPISLYISVVVAFGRLYGDSELTAMFALCVTPARVMRAIIILSGGLALIVAGLSLFARPWAYEKSHQISRRAENLLDVGALRAGTFYTGEQGNRVIYLTHRDGPGGSARDVFVQLRRSDHIEIIYARSAYQVANGTSDGSNVYMRDAYIYDIGNANGPPDRILNTKSMVLNPNNQVADPPEYSPVAAGSEHLAVSRAAPDIAELEWRLSTPLSTLLLGMLAVPLSRVQPRQGRYTRMGTAILVYSGYYLLCTSARTWVQHGAVPPIPGLWWAPGLLALALLTAVAGPVIRFRHQRAWRHFQRRFAAADNASGSHDAA
jgi:lipopolysaccharide export system permease protein